MDDTITKSDLARRADDALVSVVLIADSDAETLQRATRAAQDYLTRNFAFHELLIVARAEFHRQHADEMRTLVASPDIRCIVLRNGIGEYRAAMLGASESIGDLVLILSAAEAGDVDLDQLYKAAAETGSAVAHQPGRAGLFSGFGGRVLSLVSGYRVDPGLLRSCAHHRAYLNRLAQRPDGEIALRFMRGGADEQARVARITVDRAKRTPGARGTLWRRFGIASEILVNAPPYLLRLMAAASVLGVFSALIYMIYALTLFVIGFPLQPGWLTTSLAISGMTGFICLALAAISIALYQILGVLREDNDDEIVQEIGNVDLFRDFHEVNVDTQRSA